jgi:hypothetical protein
MYNKITFGGIINRGFFHFFCICYDGNGSPMNRLALSKVEVFISAGALKMGQNRMMDNFGKCMMTIWKITPVLGLQNNTLWNRCNQRARPKGTCHTILLQCHTEK